MPASQTLLVEIGNSTIKLAHVRPDGAMDVVRYDSPEEFLKGVAGLEPAPGMRMVCVPVGREPSAQLLPELANLPLLRGGTALRVIERADVAGFVGTSYDTPDTLGLDRVLNLLGLGGDGIAISCGTAITVDAVNGGSPMWGAIAPGFRTAAQGLHDRVPVLPLVTPDDRIFFPARDSRTSVANGVIFGAAVAAHGIAHALAFTAFNGDPPRIVLTGGDAPLLARLWMGAAIPEVDDLLLFRGALNVAGR
ncbi:MAG TPA: type III pantothenate kinase [Candidatus Kapabacteria bacterium]|nr:type III pantothenate kinase [Candidatus Kapabacteria bacterium]